MSFKVLWDNGAEACGEFDQVFDTEEDAQAFADNWASDRNFEDLGLTEAEVNERGGEDCYTAEVIEVEPEPDSEELDALEELSWLHDAGLNHRGQP